MTGWSWTFGVVLALYTHPAVLLPPVYGHIKNLRETIRSYSSAAPGPSLRSAHAEKQRKRSWLVLSGGEAIIISHYSTHLEPINLFYLLIRAGQWAQLFYTRGDAGDHLLVS